MPAPSCESAPLLVSSHSGPSGVVVEEGHQGAHYRHVPASPEHHIMLVLQPGTARLRRKSGEELFDGVPEEGMLSIVPAGQSGSCGCEGCIRALRLRLAPDFVARVAQENFGSTRFRLATRLGVRDEPMRQIALLLRAELHAQNAEQEDHLIGSRAGSSLLIESLARALTVYLLRFHAHFHTTNAGPVCEVCGGLSDRALERVTVLVAERLAGVSLDEMAGAAHRAHQSVDLRRPDAAARDRCGHGLRRPEPPHAPLPSSDRHHTARLPASRALLRSLASP